MTKAFDVHMHLLPLNHVCLTAYLDYAKQNSLIEAYAQATAADYIASGIVKREGNALNIVAVMERTAAEQIALYEADLSGRYTSDILPVITGRGLELYGGGGKKLRYDKLVICPQVMDFNMQKPVSLYYSDAPDHDILRQAEDMLAAVHAYHKAHPDGRLEILPFIGINPLNYDEDYIGRVLETCFPSGATAGTGDTGGGPSRFGGVKVYPPMGFDPNPAAGTAEAAKMELLFAFCEKHALPIVTHCDDQGFRMLPLEDSFAFTSPERWEPVLARHPDLWIDFAHFGEQYYRGFPLAQLKDWPQKILASLKKTELSWRDRILGLMRQYPHVYADVSFGGASSDNWSRLMELLDGATDSDRALYEDRVLFGTDWPLSLTKTPSALHYWRGFSDSVLPHGLADKLLCKNPTAFLFH